jgi:hypothetical protein
MAADDLIALAGRVAQSFLIADDQMSTTGNHDILRPEPRENARNITPANPQQAA